MQSKLPIACLPVVRPDDINLRGRARPLSVSLEKQMIALCARQAPYWIEALPIQNARQAPDSLASLLDATAGRVHKSSDSGAGWLTEGDGPFHGMRIPVWAGASARIIWSGPRVNWLFRAWHDCTHIETASDFDQDGELRVARAQCALIEGKPERAILWAETAGQVLYHCAHGAFPQDQRRFVLDAIRFGLDLTIERGLYHAL